MNSHSHLKVTGLKICSAAKIIHAKKFYAYQHVTWGWERRTCWKIAHFLSKRLFEQACDFLFIFVRYFSWTCALQWLLKGNHYFSFYIFLHKLSGKGVCLLICEMKKIHFMIFLFFISIYFFSVTWRWQWVFRLVKQEK